MTKITGLKADDLEELLKGEDGEPLSNAPGIVADKVGERITEIKNAEFNKAKSKTAKALESIVKSAGIEEFEDVDDAVRKLADKANEKGQSGDSIDLSTLTPSQLAKIPAFQAFKEAKESELSTLKADYEKTVKTQKLDTIASKSKEEALSFLSKMNAKFTVPEMQLNAVFKLIGVENLDLDEKGKTIILDKNGEPLLDAHHNRVNFEDKISEIWEPLFGFNTIDPNKKTPQPPAGKQGQQSQTTGIKFDSYEEATKMVNREADNVRRSELRIAMNAQFPEGKPK